MGSAGFKERLGEQSIRLSESFRLHVSCTLHTQALITRNSIYEGNLPQQLPIIHYVMRLAFKNDLEWDLFHPLPPFFYEMGTPLPFVPPAVPQGLLPCRMQHLDVFLQA